MHVHVRMAFDVCQFVTSLATVVPRLTMTMMMMKMMTTISVEKRGAQAGAKKTVGEDADALFANCLVVNKSESQLQGIERWCPEVAEKLIGVRQLCVMKMGAIKAAETAREMLGRRAKTVRATGRAMVAEER